MSANKVYSAINAVQTELASVGVSKDRKNEQQGYKFRGIDDMYNAIAPLLAKHKLLILPEYSDRIVTERTTTKGSVLFYVSVAGKFRFVSAEDGSDHVVGPFYGEAMDSGDKATNKAQSGSFKYMAMQTFCIPTEGDNDADATTHEVRAKSAADVYVNKDRPNNGAQVAKDAFDLMDDATKDYLNAHARTIIGLFEGKGDIAGYIKLQDYDVESKLALWSLLPSNVRSAIKKQQAGMMAYAEQG